jgi:peptide/nickel transport system substrate-binding protein
MRSAAALLALVALAACAHVASPQAAGGRHAWTIPHVLRMADLAEPDHLNPYLSQMDVTYDLSSLLYSFLTVADDRGRLIGDLALETPSLANGGISSDGRRYVYHLRRGVVWHDGAPFSARDVIASWRAVMDPHHNTLHREGYDRIVSIDAPNPYTVVVRLDRRYPPFVTQFFAPLQEGGKPILPAHVLERERDFNVGGLNTHPVGTGPFRFVSWERGSRIVLARNDRYFKGRPRLERVELDIVPSDQTILAQVQEHQLDLVVSPPSALADQYRALPDVVTALYPWNAQMSLGFNCRKALLADPAVRRALAASIDYDRLIATVTHGVGETAYNTLPPTATGYEKLTPHHLDLSTARALLDASGWRLGSDGIRSKKGQRLALTIASIAGATTIGQVALELQAQLRAAGIELAIKPYPYNTVFAIDGPIYGGTYDLAAYSTSVAWDPDVHFYLGCDQWFPKGENVYGYCNPALDKLFAQGLRYDDPRKRAPVYAAASRIIWSGAPYIPLYAIQRLVVRSPDLRNFTVNPTATPWYNAWQWDI